jgi:hypothetical protein
MTRVLAVSAQGPTSPAFRVRTGIPAPALRAGGVRIEPSPLFDLDEERLFRTGGTVGKVRAVLSARPRLARALATTQSFDTVLVQRQVDLLPGLQLERRARRFGRLVLDVDDAIWLDTRRVAGGHPLAFLKRSPSKLRWLAERADHVTAGSDRLAEQVARHATTVTVVPSLIDTDQIRAEPRKPHDSVTLGWIGSATTARYLTALEPELERTARARPGLAWELIAIGGRAPQVAGMRVASFAWSEARERELLGRMDIGLMPLPDDPWTRGKCAYKALQYMGAGVPVVADAVGVSAAVIGHHAAGLIVPRRAEWPDALVTLAEHTELRSRLGAEGRRRVEADFSVKRWAPVLASILKGQVPA